MDTTNKVLRGCLAIIFIISIFALGAQLYLIIINRATPIIEAIVRYISFFTIQSNLLVALCTGFILQKRESPIGEFFAGASVFSAITVYIVVVGVVYNLVLRQIWSPTGLQRMVDELLHVVVPILFLLFWIVFVPKQHLKWNILNWLIYPFLYTVYIMVRGHYTGYYPYPFLDVNKFGLTQVGINIGVIMAGFVGFSLLLVAVGRLMVRKKAVV